MALILAFIISPCSSLANCEVIENTYSAAEKESIECLVSKKLKRRENKLSYFPPSFPANIDDHIQSKLPLVITKMCRVAIVQ